VDVDAPCRRTNGVFLRWVEVDGRHDVDNMATSDESSSNVNLNKEHHVPLPVPDELAGRDNTFSGETKQPLCCYHMRPSLRTS